MFSFLVCEKIFHIFCENFAKFILNFAKISRNLLGISRKSTMLFSQNFAKFKIFSSKFRVSRNFLNAVLQPPYLYPSYSSLPLSVSPPSFSFALLAFYPCSPPSLTPFFLFVTSPCSTHLPSHLLLSLSPLFPPCLIFLHSPIPYHFFFLSYPSP